VEENKSFSFVHFFLCCFVFNSERILNGSGIIMRIPRMASSNNKNAIQKLLLLLLLQEDSNRKCWKIHSDKSGKTVGKKRRETMGDCCTLFSI